MRSGLRLALAGGGTGGHVAPGLALLEGLACAGQLEHALWLGSGREAERRALEGLERAVGQAPSERVELGLERAGGGAPSKLALAASLPREILRARRALLDTQSQLCVALGGYPCLPSALAARAMGLPLAFLEVNAVAGRVTKSLGRLGGRVLHAWPTTKPRGSGARHVVIGPLLSERCLSASERSAALVAELQLDSARPLLVVLGGSQGAGALNVWVARHAASLIDNGLAILHQLGPGRSAEAASARAHYQAREFLHDVPAAIAAATLVLCRGGASTLAEVGALRRPAWVVPYPHHADRQQEHNAALLGGGVHLRLEDRLDESLVPELVHAAGLEGAAQREAMAEELAQRVPLDGLSRSLDELAALVS